MHCTVLAPLLSATVSRVCVWIMVDSLSIPSCALARLYRERREIISLLSVYPAASDVARRFEHAHHAPRLGLGDRAAGLDQHRVARLARTRLPVPVQLAAARHD